MAVQAQCRGHWWSGGSRHCCNGNGHGHAQTTANSGTQVASHEEHASCCQIFDDAICLSISCLLSLHLPSPHIDSRYQLDLADLLVNLGGKIGDHPLNLFTEMLDDQ